MQALVSSEHRFERTPDGAVWTANINSYSFWTRYLDVFDEVRVLARIREVERPEEQWVRADGPNVHFHAVPCFIGPRQYVQSCFTVKRAIASGLSGSEAVIMRVPSVLSHTMTKLLRRSKHPFGLEVVGDPYDVFAPGAIQHPLRHILRMSFSSNLRMQCREAAGVAYVTANALQRRYPCKAVMVGISDVILPNTAFTTSYSSIELKLKQILVSGRDRSPKYGQATLVFVGTLTQLYKAPDVLIRAVAQAVAKGCDIQLRIVGDGRFRTMLEDMTRKLGIADRCEFLGQVPGGTAVQQILDDSDIFVLPSRVEGLPRAMIEAMARGLPCIGSKVGGIPELLDPEDLVEPGDVNGLCLMIERIANSPERQKKMSIRNLHKSREYADDKLTKKRIRFYRHIKQVTAQHLKKDGNLAEAPELLTPQGSKHPSLKES